MLFESLLRAGKFAIIDLLATLRMLESQADDGILFCLSIEKWTEAV